jgi:hypothetical protein
LHLFPFAEKRVDEKLENVKGHHGVIVNYNTKSIASVFFAIPISHNRCQLSAVDSVSYVALWILGNASLCSVPPV